jgi:hypothetical protein
MGAMFSAPETKRARAQVRSYKGAPILHVPRLCVMTIHKF